MTDALFEEALAHHRAGRLSEAELLYRRIVAADPRHADSLHLLGMIACQVGRHDLAVGLIGAAIAIESAVAEYYSNLGVALKELGRLDQALASFDNALALKPDYAHAAAHRKDAFARGNDPVFMTDLGNALQRQGLLDEAVAAHRQAIALKPDFAEAHYNLGITLVAQNRLDEAIAAYRQAIALKPDFAEAHTNLGNALHGLGRLDEAAESHRQAIALEPDFAQAHNNLGSALGRLCRWQEAISHQRRATELMPDTAEFHSNLGVNYCNCGQLDKAIACQRRAVEIAPDYAEAHYNLGHALMLAGDYSAGWPELEWRFRDRTRQPRPFPQARWRGEDLRGRTLLVWGEQGIGDELLFFAFLPELLALGATLVVECAPRLAPILGHALPQITIAARSDPPDPRCLAADVEFQIPAISVASLLRPTRSNFRPLSPYLRPDPELVAEFRQRYGAGAPLVGLSWWSGNDPQHNTSFALSQWRPILEVPGVRFVSVQYGDRRVEIEAVVRALGASILQDDSVDPLVDLDRASAQIAAMDLTVTMQNSTLHLAALANRPAFLLAPFIPDWWTGLTGETSPWAPGATLFRQQNINDWPATIRRAATALRRWVQIR